MVVFDPNSVVVHQGESSYDLYVVLAGDLPPQPSDNPPYDSLPPQSECSTQTL